MNNKEEIKLSKYLSYILRHNPSEIDLDVDKSGWALLSELIEKSAQKNTLFTKEDVFFVVKIFPFFRKILCFTKKCLLFYKTLSFLLKLFIFF